MRSSFPEPTTRHDGATVLVVEDQRLVAADLAMQLRGFGYRVLGFATNGLDAVNKARELEPDIVLMDVHLEGEMDGTEAARLIRQHSPCAIVFLTAFSDLETLERAKLAEPGGYIVKPASPVELRCAVEVALHKQQKERERASDRALAYDQQLESVRGRLTELEAAYRELEACSSSLTHDLRNPLQVISGAAEMIERTQGEQLTPLGRVFLNQVGSAADRMMERLGSLLELARESRAELAPSAFDLAELAQQVFEELAVRSPSARCTVVPSMPVYADRALIRRLLENLIANGLKFTRGRERPLLEVGMLPDGADTCYYVRDNGVGFSMASAEGKLFTAYGRLHDDKQFAGTGLGLAGARRIVERHGGRIWAHGLENGGATFFFTLPTRR